MDNERYLQLEVLKSEIQTIRNASEKSIKISIGKAKALGMMVELKENLGILLSEETNKVNKRIIEEQIIMTENEIDNIGNVFVGLSNSEIKKLIDPNILKDIEGLTE